ncbi:uncharacterized protein EV420DRAFT_7766 [Desarmillaria tabescens]|uniref:Uncharacterized protein n=1 Tax=Armillaria tabescens TaxID=1929756 RepID=A0AA39NNU2_ARMTA|nr:uncharacterized protein EV420DRAFT_7766 [Desarmillaria tabescens]KAK0469087.1 hypothetical protein EV420DRAFT_7766 [Desarmillaria tabescens]
MDSKMLRAHSRDGRGSLVYSRYDNTSRSVNVRETRETVERVDFVDAGGRVRYSRGTREQVVTDYRATTNSGSYKHYTRNMGWRGSQADGVRAREYAPTGYLEQELGSRNNSSDEENSYERYGSDEDVESGRNDSPTNYYGEDDYEDGTAYQRETSPEYEYHPPSDNAAQEFEDHSYGLDQEEPPFPGDNSEYYEEYEGTPELDGGYGYESYSPPASPELHSDHEYGIYSPPASPEGSRESDDGYEDESYSSPASSEPYSDPEVGPGNVLSG